MLPGVPSRRPGLQPGPGDLWQAGRAPARFPASLSAHGRSRRGGQEQGSGAARTAGRRSRSSRFARGPARDHHARTRCRAQQGSAGRGREVQKQRPKEAVGYIFEGDAHAVAEGLGGSRRRLSCRTQGGRRQRTGHQAAFGADRRRQWRRGRQVCRAWLKDHAKDARFRLYLAENASAARTMPAPRSSTASCSRRSRRTPPAQQSGLGGGQLKDPKAIEYAEKANKLAPDQAAVMDTLAVIADGQGR
jgi:hypothetical protein